MLNDQKYLDNPKMCYEHLNPVDVIFGKDALFAKCFNRTPAVIIKRVFDNVDTHLSVRMGNKFWSWDPS